MDTGVRAGFTDPAEEDREPTSRSSKKERTRARLLSAAEEVFGMRGFNDASIVEITQKANVALGTFYVYFPSKTAIFNYIIETRIGDLRDSLRAAQEGTGNRRSVERAVLRAFMEWATAHPHAYRAARQAEYVEGTRLRDWYQKFVLDYSTRLKGAMAAGELEPTDPEVLAWSLVGMADLLATHWITWGGTANAIPTEKLDVFLDIAMRALGMNQAS
jgi:AcrR family transcriptional regulator